MAKLYNGITDTPVTMACKSHLRNGRPLLIAPATNDGLSINARNIGGLMSIKNVYFVPFGPVSYTHLDVYKRQVLDTPLIMSTVPLSPA